LHAGNQVGEIIIVPTAKGTDRKISIKHK